MMQIMSTFEHSVKLELAISALELAGIQKQHIFAVPLTNRKVDRRLLDNLHNSDGVTLFSTGAALATAFAVVGASIGFSLKWGPIYWGLISAGSGFLIGFFIDLFINKVLKKHKRLLKGKNPQVILIVERFAEFDFSPFLAHI
ncbi:hypothetical protein ACOALA_03255 [Alicyclobacillus acidoterrestris]|uniref:Uncharacterized protein n=2 Tax=Alicyclobacillus acidoterrestris TaxID=1450 RepID=A0A9E7CQW8_ALIAG|nr:hypothetical protein [Alicyclobacillus acidoterrestris]UNO48699.1 hypothetical protein K1I37_18910 [Alicyclobacillus acidoterrestris]